MGLIIYYLGCYGLTMIIVQSVIFSGIRNFTKAKSNFFGKLLSCMMCTGFWVMNLAGLTIEYSPVKVYFSSTGIFGILFNSFAGVTVITFIYLIQLAIEETFKIEW